MNSQIDYELKKMVILWKITKTYDVKLRLERMILAESVVKDTKLFCRSSAQFIVAEDATARRIEPVLRARGHCVSLHRLNELLPRNHIPALA